MLPSTALVLWHHAFRCCSKPVLFGIFERGFTKLFAITPATPPSLRGLWPRYSLFRCSCWRAVLWILLMMKRSQRIRRGLCCHSQTFSMFQSHALQIARYFNRFRFMTDNSLSHAAFADALEAWKCKQHDISFQPSHVSSPIAPFPAAFSHHVSETQFWECFWFGC
jgi:hypothetical protein